MAWGRRKKERLPEDDGARGPLREQFPGDWVVVPYRIAEACRLSMYTIAAHPDMPEPIAAWVADWLAHYNSTLTGWFEENYGKDIFKTLDIITDSVRQMSESYHAEQHDHNMTEWFDRWEAELDGTTPDDPPAPR